MGRLYTVQFNAVTLTGGAQQDLFEIVAPADAIVKIHDFNISQSSDVGDAAEEILSVLMKSGSTTTGSGGTSPTAVPNELGDAAFGGTTKCNNTTTATGGTIVTHAPFNWNIRMPLVQIWQPETRPILSPSRRWTLELATNPADALTASGFVTFEEIGG
jgi:hypothetical protein